MPDKSLPEYEKLGAFYLGKEKDSGRLLLYDSKDLVTHAVCVGMTGSGKTGLCIGLLEEAAIDGIPAIVIDPKGDLGNLLLTFPGLTPEEFAPWVSEDEARKKGLSVQEFAAQQAAQWKAGLSQWGEDGARIQRLRDAAEFVIYTPGSDAGVGLSVMNSFTAPEQSARDDREMMRDRVTATASSLLALAGIDADPIQSREHALVANILDTAWKQGQDLDLGAIIAQIQSPPFAKVGVLDLESFYPAKDRFGLATALNNLLASPGFEAWLQGEPLEINSLLYTPKGKPRLAIISIAHLSDAERMFVVSLVLNQVLGWVRGQKGTSSLRAIFYMDEIFGYFPPVASPPSKKPLLTLLKQARAFGLGVVLATQNPVDLDYKGLANTGTWFIGRLQTERDKARVMEGLEGAAAAAGGKFDRAAMERILAGLGSRIFLLSNVHEDKPELFETRWTLSYLRGPLARPEIKKLMASAAPVTAPDEPAAPAASKPAAERKKPAAGGPPVLPPDVTQFYVPVRSTGEVAYQARILGAAKIQFADPKTGVDQVTDLLFAVPCGDGAVAVNWEQAETLDVPLSDLEKAPASGATFAELPAPAAKAKNYAAWQKAFATWLYQTQKMELQKSPSLDEVSKPGEAERDFRARLQQQAREHRDELVAQLRQKYAPKIATLAERKRRAEQAVAREKEQSQAQTISSVLSVGTSIFGAFMGRKTLSVTNINRAASAARTVGRLRKASGDVERAGETVEAIAQQLQDLDDQFKAEAAGVQTAVDPATETLEPVVLRPKKANINVQLVALGWVDLG
jgi:hypothetical protein